MIYWDTSCVVKLYVAEDDSAEYLELAGRSDRALVSSGALQVEMYYALRQKELRGEIRSGGSDPLFRKFRADVGKGRLLLLPFGTDVAEQAVDAARRCHDRGPPVPLRSMDGVHLATALVAGIKYIATADERMRAAADLLGLSVITP